VAPRHSIVPTATNVAPGASKWGVVLLTAVSLQREYNVTELQVWKAVKSASPSGCSS